MRARACAVQFWTGASSSQQETDRVSVKHTDLSAFRLDAPKSSTDSVYGAAKKSYAEARGLGSSNNSKGAARLDRLLSEGGRPLECAFASATARLVFANGEVAHLDEARVTLDAYLVGKMAGVACDALVTHAHVIFTHTDNQASVLHVAKPLRPHCKIAKCEPKFASVELAGGRRRGERHISGSADGASVLIWSRASPSDLFPWSPRTPNEDHANVHIYSLNGTQLNLRCFYRIEYDPICMSFSKIHEKIIFSVEQKTSKIGGIIIECRRLEMTEDGTDLAEHEVVRVAAPAPVTCAARSPCENFLLMVCSDRSVLLHNHLHNVTTTVMAAFVARTCCWWQDGGCPAVMIGGVGLQLQCWDAALAPIHLAPVADHFPLSPVLDLSSYFRKEPTLTQIIWNNHQSMDKGFATGDGTVLAVMLEGPLVCIKIFSSSTFQCESGGGGPVISGAEGSAIARLRTMDWSSQGTSCLALLHKIINSLFLQPLNLEREDMAQAALGTFLAPTQLISSSIRQLYLPQLHDLCRRFFHHLMRYGRLEKAFSLAIDVNHHDLFMDIKYAAENMGALDLANEATLRAEELLSSCGSSCSHSSCSHCSSSSDLSMDNEPECDRNMNDLVKKIDLYGSATPSQPVNRAPPPLPCVPSPQNPFVAPKMAPVKSLNKNHHHHHHEKEYFPWAVDSTAPMMPPPTDGGRVLHRVVEIIPQPVFKTQSALELFQTELQENSSNYDKKVHLERPKVNPNILKSSYTPVYHQHPTLSGRIPSTVTSLSSIPQSYLPHINREPVPSKSGPMERIREETSSKSLLNNKDLWSNRIQMMNSLSMPMFNTKFNHQSSSLNQINKVGLPPNRTNSKTPVSVIKSPEADALKPPGEKNKVKFSDTVTVAVVPEITRKERRTDRVIGPSRMFPGTLDPQRELADSLPLSHPDDYLKDFTPQTDNSEKEKQTKFKVVHFGVV